MNALTILYALLRLSFEERGIEVLYDVGVEVRVRFKTKE